MSFDFYAMEQAILAQLAGAVAETGISVQSDDAMIDDDIRSVSAQIVFIDFASEGQVGNASRHYALWAFDTYIDITCATESEKTKVATLFSQALTALVGWEIAPGRRVISEKVQRCLEQGRLRRRSFGFAIPVFIGR